MEHSYDIGKHRPIAGQATIRLLKQHVWTGSYMFMKHYIIICALGLGLSACGTITDRLGLARPGAAGEAATTAAAMPEAVKIEQTVLDPVTSAPPPPPAARTAEALDTTTAEQRAAAVAPVAAGARVLGTTVVSLGSATEPGLWMKTPLVKTEMQGRVTNPATGKSSTVMLIPIDGPATAGSRMSLSALRLIGASLTDLTSVEVSTSG
jgi:hypothetical protein